MSRGLQLRDFILERRFKVFALSRGDPIGFPRMVPDGKPPDRQPQKWQSALEDDHFLPAIDPQQPAGEWSGRGYCQRLAKTPVSIGACAFAAGEPIGQEHESG